MVLCTGQVTAETNVPSMSVSMMMSMMVMVYLTTVASTLNGYSPSGSRFVVQSAEEPSAHVSEIMKTFKLINVILYN